MIDKVEGDSILWRHSDKDIHHWIIQICPALEKWLLKICDTEDIDLSDFGEDTLNAIKYYTKSASSMNDPRLRSLFDEISKCNENLSIRKLKGSIKLLKERNYKVDINQLINA